MKTAPTGTLLLRRARWPLVRNFALLPLGMAAVWLWADYEKWGRVPLVTLILSSAMVTIALFGVVAALVPSRLQLDNEGLSWSQWGRTRTFRWSEIEDVGIARARGMEGLDERLVKTLAGGAGKHFAAPMIGLNTIAALSEHKEAVRRAQLRGYSGYEINIGPWFGESTEQVVEEIRRRWLLHRGRQHTE